jgi:hypothetical protein
VIIFVMKSEKEPALCGFVFDRAGENDEVGALDAIEIDGVGDFGWWVGKKNLYFFGGGIK